jgi:hypothetical protein
MLNHRAIAQRVINELESREDSLGIRMREGGRESATAAMIKIMMREIVFAIQAEAEVNTVVQTAGSPTNHTGVGKGKVS